MTGWIDRERAWASENDPGFKTWQVWAIFLTSVLVGLVFGLLTMEVLAWTWVTQ